MSAPLLSLDLPAAPILAKWDSSGASINVVCSDKTLRRYQCHDLAEIASKDLGDKCDFSLCRFHFEN